MVTIQLIQLDFHLCTTICNTKSAVVYCYYSVGRERESEINCQAVALQILILNFYTLP